MLALEAREIAKNGDSTNSVWSYLAQFFASPASLQRYERKPWCQAITMATSSAKLHARQRKTTELFGFRMSRLSLQRDK
jgi:hypothetical protein